MTQDIDTLKAAYEQAQEACKTAADAVVEMTKSSAPLVKVYNEAKAALDGWKPAMVSAKTANKILEALVV